MSHELIYTSAQQGLRPGSYGFCTVMATEGLPKVLQDRLESLSGYEHAFGLTDRRSELNPVNYSHLIVSVANQRLHLLSRIADARADYSGRSNKLAHHVVLHPNELTAAGPAATLSTLGFCKTIFEGPPRWVPYGVLPPASAHPFESCQAWKDVCDDAGWAGVLAELTLKTPGRPITLIYEPGCDVLPLVVQAMSLLPPDRQWSTTFSTYFTRLPAGIECQWRFVLGGTAAADQARRNLQSPPLELSHPGRIPFETPLVIAARTGRLPEAMTRRPTEPTDQTAPAKSKPAAGVPDIGRTDLDSAALPLQLGSVPMRLSGGFVLHNDDDLFAKQKRLSRQMTSAIIGGVALLMIAVGMGVYLANGSMTPSAQRSTDEIIKSKDPRIEIEKPAFLDAKSGLAKRTLKSLPAAPPKVTSPETQPSETKVELAEPVKPPKSDAEILAEVARDIEARRRVLSLPRREQSLGLISGPHELCKFFLRHPADCELKLVTTEVIDDGKPRLFLARVRSTDENIQTWNAMVRHKNTTTQIVDETQIGMFQLQDQILTFQWNAAPDWTSPFGLLYCKLDIQIGKAKLQCSLTKPMVKNIDRIDLSHRRGTLPIEISANSLLSAGMLFYDIELQLDEWKESRVHINTVDQQFLKFVIPSLANARNTQVELELRVDPPTESHNAALSYRAFVFPTYLKAVAGTRWEHVTRRNDLIDEKSIEGFIVPSDSTRFRKLAADDRRKATLEHDKATAAVSPAQIELSAKDRALSAATTNGDHELMERLKSERDKIAMKLRDLKNYERYYQEAVDHGDAAIAWSDAIHARFKTIEEKLEIRLTVYLEFQSDSHLEQVVLVETNSPPSNRRSKSLPEAEGSNPNLNKE